MGLLVLVVFYTLLSLGMGEVQTLLLLYRGGIVGDPI